MMRIRNNGFTLVELLVTITVIGLLIALLVPALQSAREASRRLECVNRLKQIGLAVHNHEESLGVFPAGNGRPSVGDAWVVDASLLVTILPFMEQIGIYNSINVTDKSNFLIMSDANMTVSTMCPSSFLCPSEPSTPSDGRMRTNFAGNAGLSHVADQGVFDMKALSPRELTDGLSCTIGVSEWIAGSGTLEAGDRLGSIYQFPSHPTALSVETFAEVCRGLENSGGRVHVAEKGVFWIEGGLGLTQYNHTLPPNQPSCEILYDKIKSYTAGSHHDGGANTLRMDGSVKFTKSTIDSRVWSALGTRAGGEVGVESDFP